MRSQSGTLPPSVRDLVNLLMADGAAVEQMKERAAACLSEKPHGVSLGLVEQSEKPHA